MKKMTRLFFAVLACFLTGFVMASCSFFEDETATFEISNYPKVTYVMNEDLDWSGLSIKLSNTEYYFDSIDERNSLITLSNGVEKITVSYIVGKNPTGTKGVYSITLKYDNAKVSFQYSVLDSRFANGNGTINNPYQISTVDQFYEALKPYSKTTYFELINNIDFENNYECQSQVMNAVIDGKNYSLMNISDVIVEEVYDSTLKNMKLYYSQTEDLDIQFQMVVAFFTEGNTTYDNLDFYGRIDMPGANNSSLFGWCNYRTNNSTIIINDCDVYADIIGPSCEHLSVYTSGGWATGVLYITNCDFYGTMVAKSCGLIYSNTNGSYSGITFVLGNNHAYGRMVSTTNKSNAFCGNHEGTKNNYDVINGTYLDKNGTVCSTTPFKVYKFNEDKGHVLSNLFSSTYGESDKYTSMEQLCSDLTIKMPEFKSATYLTVDCTSGKLVLINNGLNDVDHYEITVTGNLIDLPSNGYIGNGLIARFGNKKEYATVDDINKLNFELLLFANYFENEPQINIDGRFVVAREFEEGDFFGTATIEGKKYYTWNSESDLWFDGNEDLYSMINSKWIVYNIIAYDNKNMVLETVSVEIK